MLGSVGDLVEDVVVHLHEPVNIASDTRATVIRRRGGSAANVVAAACRLGAAARFIGQVGDDATGRGLADALLAQGASVIVGRAGRTGSIIVMLDPNGERTMLSDRGACTDLAAPLSAWLDDLDTLHIPFYSLIGEPLATTTSTLVAWAAERGIRVSIDTSSAAVLLHVGPATALERIRSLQPQVVLANELEAETLGPELHPDNLDGALVIIKRGAKPAVVLQAGHSPLEVAAEVVADVRDTTGAGDAFAAGLLLALAAGEGPSVATTRAHAVAADAIRHASAAAD